MTTMDGLAAESLMRGDNSTPGSGDLESLTLVQIAERLERVTSLIEAERVRERDARTRYRQIADEVEARITAIKTDAASLVREQQRRLSSFDGMISIGPSAGTGRGAVASSGDTRRRTPLDTPSNISDAIVRIWSLPEYDEPLSTDEIAEALPAVGYESKAAPRSLRSAVNQALAKLCRSGRMEKYRQDGTVITRRETGARARRYKPTA